jgi:hypothetical protein
METDAHGLLAMPGVGFFGMLIIGILEGDGERSRPAHQSARGIAGSFVGGSLANLLDIHYQGWLGNLIVASIGAVLLLWVWRRLGGTT